MASTLSRRASEPLRAARAIGAPRTAGWSSSGLGDRCSSGSVPFALQAPRCPQRRRLHPRRPRIGTCEGAAPDRDRRRPGGRRRRPPLATRCAPASPAFEAAAASGDRGRPDGAVRPRACCRTCSRRARSSADGHTAYDVVLLDLSADDSPKALPGLRAALHEAPGLEVGLSGGPAFYGDVQAVSEADLRRSELISLPLAALALLLVFGSVVAAGGAARRRRRRGRRRARRRSSSSPALTPMSIFVLNLATLLGPRPRRRLLAADDEPVPRGAGGARRAARTPSRTPSARPPRTAGRAVFFSGPDGPARAARPRAVRVHDPALRRASPARSSSRFAVAAAMTLLPACSRSSACTSSGCASAA